LDLPDKKPPDAVAEAIDRQGAYERRRPTRLGRGVEALTSRLGPVLSKVIPPEWVLRALEMSDHAAGWTVPKMDHDHNTLEDCHAAALRVQGWAQGLNASSGFTAGVWGGPGLAVDIPATLVLAARSVRATGVAYGFDGDNADERTLRLMVLEVATVMASDAREETLGRFNRAVRRLNDPALSAVAETGIDHMMSTVVEKVARQLGVSLAGRKFGQIVPVAGGLFGAVVNASFQADVARAARYAYEKRWLMARQMLEAPDV